MYICKLYICTCVQVQVHVHTCNNIFNLYATQIKLQCTCTYIDRDRWYVCLSLICYTTHMKNMCVPYVVNNSNSRHTLHSVHVCTCTCIYMYMYMNKCTCTTLCIGILCVCTMYIYTYMYKLQYTAICGGQQFAGHSCLGRVCWLSFL